jgi:4'-phosphopantetheinyl transferase
VALLEQGISRLRRFGTRLYRRPRRGGLFGVDMEPLTFSFSETISKLEIPAEFQSHAVDLWRVRLATTFGGLAQATTFLSADEQSRADRFLVDTARAQFVLSRAALRRILSTYTLTPPEGLRFVYSQSGKPSLPQESASEISFNVSHCRDVALIAVATGRRVGVDVEFIQERPELAEIALRFLSPAERSVLECLRPPDWNAAFYSLWTRKEAVMKASGAGITAGLETFDASLALFEPGPAWCEFDGARWVLSDIIPAPGYVGALALEAGDQDGSETGLRERDTTLEENQATAAKDGSQPVGSQP